MAALEISGQDWADYLARDDVDFTIEELILEGPDGAEYHLPEDSFHPSSMLKIHEGVVNIEGVKDEVCLKKHIRAWLDTMKIKAEENDARPYVMVKGPAHLLKAIEAMAKSFQLVDKTIEVTVKLV
ncbi:MAG: hypothetical protein ACRCTP_04190 [Aeromonas popoffii]|uniref:hypothetical protein n=1 Tax=Aeromonas popoffii TaxID=70856 RepID=UPI003F3513F7